MGQYTDRTLKALQVIEYLEEAEKAVCLEGAKGRITITYNHGGSKATFHRDYYDEDTDTQYKAGDVILEDPIDDLYIKYSNEYNNSTPLFAQIKSIMGRITGV